MWGKLVKENCYIYIMRNNKITIKKGIVKEANEPTYFQFNTPGKRPSIYKIRSIPGVVYNSCVWFDKQDNEAARQAFLAHENKTICELKQALDDHLAKQDWILYTKYL